MKWNLILVLICIAVITKYVENIFRGYCPFIYVFLEKCLFRFFVHLNWVICLFYYWVVIVYVFCVQSSIRFMIYEYFLPLCVFSFYFLDSVIWSIKTLHFDGSICLNLSSEPAGRNKSRTLAENSVSHPMTLSYPMAHLASYWAKETEQVHTQVSLQTILFKHVFNISLQNRLEHEWRLKKNTGADSSFLKGSWLAIHYHLGLFQEVQILISSIFNQMKAVLLNTPFSTYMNSKEFSNSVSMVCKENENNLLAAEWVKLTRLLMVKTAHPRAPRLFRHLHGLGGSFLESIFFASVFLIFDISVPLCWQGPTAAKMN